MGGPYRDDDAALRAAVAQVEQRAEYRARVTEAALARKRRGLWLTAVPEELLVVHGRDGLRFLEPGASMLGIGARVRGALPARRLAVRLALRDVPMRDGTADLDLIVVMGIGSDPERREVAVRQFLDRPVHALADDAAPVLEATARSVLGVRRTHDLLLLFLGKPNTHPAYRLLRSRRRFRCRWDDLDSAEQDHRLISSTLWLRRANVVLQARLPLKDGLNRSGIAGSVRDERAQREVAATLDVNVRGVTIAVLPPLYLHLPPRTLVLRRLRHGGDLTQTQKRSTYAAFVIS